MKRIYLFCSMAMSTSLMTASMRECADKHRLPIEVKAFSVSDIDEKVSIDHPDLILIGPQISFRYEAIRDKYPDIPVGVIDTDDYGMMDGEAVLKQSIRLLKAKTS